MQHKNEVEPVVIEEEGNVVEVIQKVSFRYAVDLVVMGTHGASGYRYGFIGSNTYITIKCVSCPF